MDPLLARSRFERDISSLIKNPENFEKVGVRLVKAEFPILIVGLWWESQKREILLHVEADNYDYLPVQGWWVDGSDKPLLSGKQQIPNGNGLQQQPNPYKIDRTWFCFRGWREYHDHESHQDVSWTSCRINPEYKILGTIMQLRTNLNHGGVNPV